jgi:hypothetical protein
VDPAVEFQRGLNAEEVYAASYAEVDDRLIIDIFIYNWRTGEKKRNRLTNKLTSLNLVDINLWPRIGNSLKRNFIITQIPQPDTFGKPIKIDWSDDFEDITVTPLDYLLPKKDTWFNDFFLSNDGTWGTSLVDGYSGLYGESLCRRVFVHFHGRNPNGRSKLVFVNSYEPYQRDYGAFVEHPVYGMCYAIEARKVDDEGNDQLYLRLYRMEDVQNEINRRLLEAAEGVKKQK